MVIPMDSRATLERELRYGGQDYCEKGETLLHGGIGMRRVIMMMFYNDGILHFLTMRYNRHSLHVRITLLILTPVVAESNFNA